MRQFKLIFDLAWAIFLALMVCLATTASASEDEPPALPRDLERIVRQYRIAVYQSFRNDRAAFDKRSEAGRTVLAAWRAAGARNEDREALTGWYFAATQAARSGTPSPMPPIPQFGAAKSAAPIRETDPDSEGALNSDDETLAPMSPAGRGIPADLPAGLAPGRSAIRLPTAEVPDRARVNRESIPVRAKKAAPQPIPPKLLESEVQIARRLPAPPASLASKPRISTMAVHVDPLDRTPAPQPADPINRVNMVELTARVAGYNRRLRELENRLLSQESWTTPRLGEELLLLNDLIDQRNDVYLYYGILRLDVRMTMNELLDPRPATTLLRKRTVALHRSLAHPTPFDDPVEDRAGQADILAAQLRVLDGLEKSLGPAEAE
jgi:hypothetical protein